MRFHRNSKSAAPEEGIYIGVQAMTRSNLPLYCPYCRSKNVTYKGHDASSQGRAKKRIVYECCDASCGRTFTDETLRRHEAAERTKD